MPEWLADLARAFAPGLADILTGDGIGSPIEDYEVLANITYNQRTADGLARHVAQAQRRVAEGFINLQNPVLTSKFLKQSPKIAAANLCNTIHRFLHVDPAGDFGLFYAQGVRDGAYDWTGAPGQGRFAFIADESILMEGYEIRDNLTLHSDVGHVFKILENVPRVDGKIRTALVRNRRNTHTFLVYERAGEWLCADCWHNKWTGKPLADRLSGKAPKYVYWYE